MKKITLFFILCFAIFCIFPSTSSAEDGKGVFLKYKCNNCHAMSTANIEAKTKTKAPDLVDVTIRHSKDFVHKFIKKEEGHVSCPKVDPERDGKFHTVKFSGTPKEENLLVDWLDKQRSK